MPREINAERVGDHVDASVVEYMCDMIGIGREEGQQALAWTFDEPLLHVLEADALNQLCTHHGWRRNEAKWQEFSQWLYAEIMWSYELLPVQVAENDLERYWQGEKG